VRDRLDEDQWTSLASEISHSRGIGIDVFGSGAHGESFMRRRTRAAIATIRRRTKAVISPCPAIQPDFRTQTMTAFSRLTLATLLMGSLALPAFALDTTSTKDASIPTTSSPAPAAVTAKPGHMMKIAHTTGKPSTMKPGVHNAAATSEIPAAVAKPPVPATVAGTPAKDTKAKDVTKDASKDSLVKPQAPAPVTKTN
jgi:hypothetical protein